MREKLWTKNYSLIIIGTIISAIGGVGLNLALSVTIYDNTQSTWLTGIYSAVTMIPTIVLPILVSPIIDKYSRKKIIYRLDFIMGLLFIGFAWIIHLINFNYYFYMMIGIVTTLNGIVYRLAYNSLFPNLIPKGMLQKGYAIGSAIYPLTNVIVLPVATLVFKRFGVHSLFLIEGILLLIASMFERFIDIDEKYVKKSFDLARHFADIQEGFCICFVKRGFGMFICFLL